MFVCHMQQILWLMFICLETYSSDELDYSPTMKGCFQQLILAMGAMMDLLHIQDLPSPNLSDSLIHESFPELTKEAKQSPDRSLSSPRWTHSEPFCWPRALLFAYPHWRVRYNFQLAMVWIIHALEAACGQNATPWSKTEDKGTGFNICSWQRPLQWEQM